MPSLCVVLTCYFLFLVAFTKLITVNGQEYHLQLVDTAGQVSSLSFFESLFRQQVLYCCRAKSGPTMCSEVKVNLNDSAVLFSHQRVSAVFI